MLKEQRLYCALCSLKSIIYLVFFKMKSPTIYVYVFTTNFLQDILFKYYYPQSVYFFLA